MIVPYALSNVIEGCLLPKRDLVSRDLHSIDLCLIMDRQALTLEAEKAQKTEAMSASILVTLMEYLVTLFPRHHAFLSSLSGLLDFFRGPRRGKLIIR